MNTTFDEVRGAALARLEQIFPDKVLVELSLAGPTVGVGRSTWHHHHLMGQAPFPAVRIGNKRYASIPDLANFVARRLTGQEPPTREERERAKATPKLELVTGQPKTGRPSHEEVSQAERLGFAGVSAYRAAQRAKIAAEEVH